VAKSERHAEHARPSLAAATAALTCRQRPMDAIAEHISADPATFASLPLLLASLVFLALPPDARGRAACVCRAWRDALAEPSLWTRLDTSDVHGGLQRLHTARPRRTSLSASHRRHQPDGRSALRRACCRPT
jgi:hypothetical protein